MLRLRNPLSIVRRRKRNLGRFLQGVAYKNGNSIC
jgi:hypothetical protein